MNEDQVPEGRWVGPLYFSLEENRNMNNTAEAYKIYPDAAPGPYRVERVGISPYSGPFTWGVIRSPEATFIAIAATQGDAGRVCDALNGAALPAEHAPPDPLSQVAEEAANVLGSLASRVKWGKVGNVSGSEEDYWRKLAGDIRELVGSRPALAGSPETADEYLRTLQWPDDDLAQGVKDAVETHVRYFVRWLNIEAGRVSGTPEGTKR